jgi:thiol-disulfide isomerase/thioredoxin
MDLDPALDPTPDPSLASRALSLAKDIGLSLLFGLAVMQGVGFLRAPDLADAAPALRLTAQSGAVVDLAALRGQRVIVNFWATWCGPCRAEMPMLQAIEDVPVLYVSVDDDPGALRAFVARHGLPPERVLRADAATQAAWGATTLPTTVVVGPDGAVEAAHAGIVSPLQLLWWTR